MRSRAFQVVGVVCCLATVVSAQPPGGGFPGGGPGGPGGFGSGPGGQERKLVKQFDKNNDGWLNAEERVAAREEVKKGGGLGRGGFGGRGPGGPGGFGRGELGKPGPAVKVEDARTYPNNKPFDTTILRTLFFEFENKDWEQELQDFHGTDVDVPAKLTVDGQTYKNVGVHFRGMSSYMGVPAGSKRSLNVTLDMADKKQNFHGQETFNLLNAHDDPSFLDTVLYSHIARQYIPAPKANLVKVVINGESWGVYTNVQQFDKNFLKENFKTTKGTRWKVRGSPGGQGGLEYLGDNIADYKRRYEMKTGDGTDEKAWKALIHFCKVLNTTPADKLAEALKPICDVDELLWFLALDVSLINCDGYWIRSSDYSIYLDDTGKFHFIPHDMNEAFRQPMGPGMGGGPGSGRGGPMMIPFAPPGTLLAGPLLDELKLTADQKKELEKLQKETDEKLMALMNDEQKKQWKEIKDRFPGGPGGAFGFGGPPGGPGGEFGGPGGGRGGPGGPGGFGGGGIGQVRGVELDPLVGLTDARKPLRSKILAVPEFRSKYLEYCRTIAEKSLDWKNLGPVVKQLRALIEKEVEADTRKLESFEAFKRATADDATEGVGRGAMPLRVFADQRRKYLLEVTAKK
jgi:spore coat protein CotH